MRRAVQCQLIPFGVIIVEVSLSMNCSLTGIEPGPPVEQTLISISQPGHIDEKNWCIYLFHSSTLP